MITLIKVHTVEKGMHFVEVESWPMNEYLAVTRAYQNYGAYRITHIPTGYAVKEVYYNKRKAINDANKIKNFDWKFKSIKSKKIKPLGLMVKKCLSKD